MTNYLLIGYLLGTVAYVLITAEAVRENKDGNPDIESNLQHPAGGALMALITILLSPLWPVFALGAAARWLAARMRAAAARVREYADEDVR